MLSRSHRMASTMRGDGVPRVTRLDVDNYLFWSTEMENVMRYKLC